MGNLQVDLERFNILNVLNATGAGYVFELVGSQTSVTEAVIFGLGAERAATSVIIPVRKPAPC